MERENTIKYSFDNICRLVSISATRKLKGLLAVQEWIVVWAPISIYIFKAKNKIK